MEMEVELGEGEPSSKELVRDWQRRREVLCCRPKRVLCGTTYQCSQVVSVFYLYVAVLRIWYYECKGLPEDTSSALYPKLRD
jgi:hypothetical protein